MRYVLTDYEWAAIIEGDAFLDQSEIGHASPLFMFGTACLAAAACIALFAIITAIGLVVSAAFKEESHQQQSAPREDASGVASLGNPLGRFPSTSLAPGRSRSNRHQQRRRARTVSSEARKAAPPAL
jgi:hypothetical protein